MAKIWASSRQRLDELIEENKCNEIWLRKFLNFKLWRLRVLCDVCPLTNFLIHSQNMGHGLLWHWCLTFIRPKISPKKGQKGWRTWFLERKKIIKRNQQIKLKQNKIPQSIKVKKKKKSKKAKPYGNVEMSIFKPSWSASWKYFRALSGCWGALG